MQTLAETPTQKRPVRATRKSVNYTETVSGTKEDADSSDEQEAEGQSEEEEVDELSKTPGGKYTK